MRISHKTFMVMRLEGTLAAAVVGLALMHAAPIFASSGMCGFFQPDIKFQTNGHSGMITAVTVEGAWPVLTQFVEVELGAPNPAGELRLDISGPVSGLLAIGHYSRTIPVPPLAQGDYSLEVYLTFDLGTQDDITYCGSLPFSVAAQIPTLDPLAATLLGFLLAILALRRVRHRVP